jgi:serine/threonine protein phosphatase PrpC
MVGQRGALKWRSTPHSPVGYAVESGLLEEADAMNHDERHVVSNLVGSRSMHIEIGPSRPLAPRDTVIIGSDGLFDNLHLAEVIERGKNGPPQDRITTMATLATQRMLGDDASLSGKPDDLTVLVYAQ